MAAAMAVMAVEAGREGGGGLDEQRQLPLLPPGAVEMIVVPASPHLSPELSAPQVHKQRSCCKRSCRSSHRQRSREHQTCLQKDDGMHLHSASKPNLK